MPWEPCAAHTVHSAQLCRPVADTLPLLAPFWSVHEVHWVGANRTHNFPSCWPSSCVCQVPAQFSSVSLLKRVSVGTGWCGSVDWVPACKPKGHRLDFQSRAHAWIAGQVPSRGHAKVNHTLMFLSLSFTLSPSVPLSKNKSLCGCSCHWEPLPSLPQTLVSQSWPVVAHPFS